MKYGEFRGPVIGKKLALHAIKWLKSSAGAPATIPSKSAGYFSALPIPCLPP
jgi:hypothetical protein